MAARSALIVANGTYEDARLPALEGPTEDAAALARVLGDPAIGGFEVDVLADARESVIRRRLETFFHADRARDDVLLVHFACHGLKDDGGRLYFAAADTVLDQLRSTAIADRFVHDVIEESRSQQIVLILDCCFAGAFSSAMTRRAAGAEKVDIQERFEGRGRVWLTASNSMQYAFESGERTGAPDRSVFTEALVHGLRTGEADRDGNGRISIDELYDHALDRLQAGDARQTPTKGGTVEGELIIARSRPKPKPTPLPAEVQAALDSPTLLTRIGAVAALEHLANGRDEGQALTARAKLAALATDDSRTLSAKASEAIAGLGPLPSEVLAAAEAAAGSTQTAAPPATRPPRRPARPIPPPPGSLPPIPSLPASGPPAHPAAPTPPSSSPAASMWGAGGVTAQIAPTGPAPTGPAAGSPGGAPSASPWQEPGAASGGSKVVSWVVGIIIVFVVLLILDSLSF
jgi:hypothetical protein